MFWLIKYNYLLYLLLFIGFFSPSVEAANLVRVLVSAVITIVLEHKDCGVAGVTSPLELEDLPLYITMTVCLLCFTDRTAMVA